MHPHSTLSNLAAFGGPPVLGPKEVVRWPAPEPTHFEALRAVINSGKYHRVNHPVVLQLEDAFARWAGNIPCRAVSSGTAAIHVGMHFFRHEGAEVLAAALNWPGAIGPIYFANMYPRFVDVALEDACMHDEAVCGALSPHVAIVLNTHLFGNFSRLSSTRTAMHKQSGAILLEDCAQAVGAVKTLAADPALRSDVITISGNGSKHLGAGELGIVASWNRELIDSVDYVSLASSSRGAERVFSPMTLGYNYRPNVFSAAVALTRVPTLDAQLTVRRENSAALWHELTQLPGLRPVFRVEEPLNCFCMLPLRLVPHELDLPERAVVRDRIVQLLAAEGVPATVWLREPVWGYMPHSTNTWNTNDFPNTMCLLKTMFHVGEIAPPNSSVTMRRYADCFEKVWDSLGGLKDWLVRHETALA